jgi:hypothetical protein
MSVVAPESAFESELESELEAEPESESDPGPEPEPESVIDTTPPVSPESGTSPTSLGLETQADNALHSNRHQRFPWLILQMFIVRLSGERDR